jgi:hypothetical protein
MLSVKSIGVAMAKDCPPLAMKEVMSFSPGIVATIGHIKDEFSKTSEIDSEILGNAVGSA